METIIIITILFCSCIPLGILMAKTHGKSGTFLEGKDKEDSNWF